MVKIEQSLNVKSVIRKEDVKTVFMFAHYVNMLRMKDVNHQLKV